MECDKSISLKPYETLPTSHCLLFVPDAVARSDEPESNRSSATGGRLIHDTVEADRKYRLHNQGLCHR
jgi:hypothetical protein